ncbi:ABC transporter substrate-binding protein [Thaumasiovibrio subtropicus]|nr:hypothetical protein [Thaumasiovibrio subtropicus]
MLKWLTLLLCFVAHSAFSAKVVFIHSYHADYRWVKQYRGAFFDVLTEHEVIEFEMDTKRLPEKMFKQKAREALSVIEENNPDVVVLADDNALRLLGPTLIEKKIYAVFLGINGNPRHYFERSEFIGGVLERPLLKRSISMLVDIVPDVKKVRIMMDNNVTSHAILDTAFDQRRHLNVSGIEVTNHLTSNFEEWKQSVLALENENVDALIIANYAAVHDDQDNHVALDTISRWTSEHSSVPVFAFWEYSIKKDMAIGGLTLNGTHQGKEAAIAVEYFLTHGKMPPIATPSQGEMVFSKTQLSRWGLSLDDRYIKRSRFVD